MALWGFSSLPMYPTIMKAWTPIVLLMSAMNALITFGRLQAFLIHGERHEYPSGVSGGWRYLLSLLFIQWAFLIPLIGQLLDHLLFLLTQAFKGGGKCLRVCSQIGWSPRCCIGLPGCQCRDPITILYSDCISQLIYFVVFVNTMWLGAFGRSGRGLDGVSQVR